MSNKLESFAFIGVKGATFKDKNTGAVACYLKHLVRIGIDDTLAEDFLKGGLGMEKLLTVYGDRDSKLTGSTATQTTDLIKIMSNSEIKTVTKAIDQVEEPTLTGGKFTLKLEALTGTTVEVWAIGTNGKSTKLTLGNPTTNATEFSVEVVSGKSVVTCHSTVKRCRVFYVANEEVQAIEINEITPKNWDFSGDLIAKEIETGDLYICNIKAPNTSVTPNFSTASENSASAPAAVEISVNMMKSEGHGYVYALNFKAQK